VLVNRRCYSVALFLGESQRESIPQQPLQSHGFGGRNALHDMIDLKSQ